jgi:hypothetical protein
MFGWIGQAVQAIAQNPQLAQLASFTGYHTCRAIERLSPESQRKLANIVRWGVEQAARYTLNSVLGDVGNRVIDQVTTDQDVAEFAKAVVKRGLAVGVNAALKEAGISS